MKILPEPKQIGTDLILLATFKLVWTPFRIAGCSLIQTSEGYAVRFPGKYVQIVQSGRTAVITAAADEFERGCDTQLGSAFA
jgi:hypothetical protein